MAALDFPSSPILNQLYTANNKMWQWDGTTWIGVSGSALAAVPINTGAVVQLGKVVTSGSQATITFSNIPQNYAALKIIIKCRDINSGTAGATGKIKINGDATAANYTSTQYVLGLASNATAATIPSSTDGAAIFACPGSSGNVNAVAINEILIGGYAETAFHKIVQCYCSDWNTANEDFLFSFVWKSTAAITDLVLKAPLTAFVDGTTAILLGEGPTNYSVSPFVDPALCNGRLSLTSGVPVTTADVIGATTIYWTPYLGNRMSLYSNGAWSTISSSEVSLALGTLVSAKNYDVFAYNNNGVIALEFLVWTSDTVRATALVMQDGVYVKSGDATRRYLGTFYTTATTTTEDSAAKRYLFNQYNRAQRMMVNAVEGTDSWNYTTATYRQANANTANQLNYVAGDPAVFAEVFVQALATNSSPGVGISVGVGVNSTSVNSAQTHGANASGASGVGAFAQMAVYKGYPGVGRNYLAWLEYSSAAGTTTWYGDATSTTLYQMGITGSLWN